MLHRSVLRQGQSLTAATKLPDIYLNGANEEASQRQDSDLAVIENEITSEAKIDPPIQLLKRLSDGTGDEMSFSFILW